MIITFIFKLERREKIQGHSRKMERDSESEREWM